MLTCIDVQFIFDSVRLGLSSSANILQIADVALRVVFLLLSSGMFLAIISRSSSFSCYSWNGWNVRHFFVHNQHNQNHQSNDQPKQLNLVPRSSR